MNLAPITLFVYKRPAHTRKTVEALLHNELANDSDLIIYSDAARSESDVDAVREVRRYIHQIVGFKSITIIERDTNLGLARSIVEGVTKAVTKHGRIIVLEDDVVTSQHFLTFMNAALERYSSEPRVWHISGWNYPIDPKGLEDAFFWRAMNCWGWATWADRWMLFQKQPKRLIKTWGKDEILRFNLDGNYDFWSQVTANGTGLINTWAIFWYATIFEHNGLCLNPARTLARNIGIDGSGENCADTDPFTITRFSGKVEKFPDHIEESALAMLRIQSLLGKKASLPRKLAIAIKRLFGRNTVR